MKKWNAIIILACAQFVMVLDSTVMNVSISTVVKDLNTTVTSMQTAITFYTLTMAAFMLLGAKLGDVWGLKRTFIIGSIVYAVGSLTTALSANFAMLFVGWSVIEGLGAVLVIPAIAALTAANYKGADRVKAFAVIGAVSGAAAAAGPLIGGFMTTYLDWRYVFLAEVFIMAGVVLFTKFLTGKPRAKTVPKIDILSVVLSATGLVVLVYGMLQSSKWGWIKPMGYPQINGHDIAPFGISMVAYMILIGLWILYVFYRRQQKLEEANKNPLLKASLFKNLTLRSGLSVLLAQYLVIAAVFFIMPVYLQMTLGLDALQTGIRILPLSIAIVLFSIVGTKLSGTWSPKKIVKYGQYGLVVGVLVLMGSINIELKGFYFGLGMFILGAGIGLLASQLGNINMSSVGEKDTSEVGGMQGVFQNLGSSLGTAIIGSILVGALTTSFVANIQGSDLPDNVKTYVQDNSTTGVQIVSLDQVESYSKSKGLPDDQVDQIVQEYSDSQISGIETALFGLFAISFLSLVLSRNIPEKL